MNKKVGDRETRIFEWRWRECQVCGMPAAYKITYLIAGNCRANPASSAYGKDDCSWCSDDEAFACKKHKELLQRSCPGGMSWCATMLLKALKHLGFYKVEIGKN